MKTQCWTQNAERVLLVEANMTVRLPRKPCIAVRISGCFVADCESRVGDSRLNPTWEVTLSPLISTPSSVPHIKRKVTVEEIPQKPCFKKAMKVKSNQKSTLFLLIPLLSSSSCNLILCHLWFYIYNFPLLQLGEWPRAEWPWVYLN